MSRARRHLERLRDSLTGPTDAWLLLRIVGWSLVLPPAKAVVSLPRLARLMQAEARTATRDPKREQTITALIAWVFKTRPPGTRDNCLERGLVTYRYLCRGGAHPQLIIGVARSGENVHGHVWVTIDGRPVHDTTAALERFQPILSFDSDGRMAKPGR